MSCQVQWSEPDVEYDGSAFIEDALFVTFFPQLVAGPIERATHLLPQVLADRRVDWGDVDAGLKLMLRGFFKKVVIADNLAPMTVALAGCAGVKLPASVKGGECRIFEAPPYEVLGKTTYDQDYIDGNVEAGVGGCGWKRPAARPPGLDAKTNKPAPHKAAKKKPGFFARIKARVTGKSVAPVPYIAGPPPPVAEPTPAPVPRDPVYELLGVEGKQ